ncbi:hypothetical protein susfortuna_gp26 [Clostridium phage susfortuna]|uniref:Uncharacterized protein n=1 Tax=Clostridium phage susfortuna TaxID=2316154 RepID=A0A385IRS6_9CAUD|nr:hypothetical protein HWB67_gp26 [Clostridium phage susfortuna]AXY86166.1 hypothetical protein susfortuna_gp26 [Clostridium phage susfortuna]
MIKYIILWILFNLFVLIFLYDRKVRK